MLGWRENLSHSPDSQTLDCRIGSRGMITHRLPSAQHDLFHRLLKLIYPSYCCYCRKSGYYLCPTCFELIELLPWPVELKLDTVFLDEVSVLGSYSEPLISVIHSLKYQSVKGIATLCAELLYMYAKIPTADAIVPVPLSQQRWRERGFNQVEEIGQELARLLNVPCVPLLKRVKHSPPQASISNETIRKKRLSGCFELNEQISLLQPSKTATILLIDDVLTTGSTLNQCAKILKDHGYQRTNALTLAHGS